MSSFLTSGSRHKPSAAGSASNDFEGVSSSYTHNLADFDDENDEDLDVDAGPESKPWETSYGRVWETTGYDAKTGTWVDKSRQSQRGKQDKETGSLSNKGSSKSSSDSVRRGLLRSFVICVDASEASGAKDFKPSRLQVVLDELQNFIRRFHDENPLSSAAVIVTKSGAADKITDLSRSSAMHAKALRADVAQGGGAPSLQNALELAGRMLAGVPSYGTREFLFIASSAGLLDPGDVHVSIDHMAKQNVRCSAIHLACALDVLRRMATRTKGRYGVATSVRHFRELLSEHFAPPIEDAGKPNVCYLVPHAFPSQLQEQSFARPEPAWCVDIDDVHAAPYYCPRCLVAVSALPSTCKVCALPLISSSHLARSYHHIFPVAEYELVESLEATVEGPTAPCRGCGASPCGSSETGDAFRCPKCKLLFCQLCNETVHEVLYACPGC